MHFHGIYIDKISYSETLFADFPAQFKHCRFVHQQESEEY